MGMLNDVHRQRSIRDLPKCMKIKQWDHECH
jgi:hypothetical protein